MGGGQNARSENPGHEHDWLTKTRQRCRLCVVRLCLLFLFCRLHLCLCLCCCVNVCLGALAAGVDIICAQGGEGGGMLCFTCLCCSFVSFLFT